jgi:hypothetical protein
MKRKSLRLATSMGCAALLCGATSAFAQTAPTLGPAQSFTVLGGSTVTNTGTTTITGDVGVSPGSAVTGFPPGLVVSGTIHAANAVALAAQNSVITAYNSLAGQPCTVNLTGQDLGGLTLTPGVYCFDTSAQLTGTLTLDAEGAAGAVFIFKTGSTLTTASGSSVSMINGGTLCNVYWQIGSSATLGTGSSFGGNILALTSITLTTGATMTGRALARNGAVTLDTNVISNLSCRLACPVITLSPPTLPNGAVGTAYTQTMTASGGTAPFIFTSTGVLPPGLTLSAGGVLAGTPTTAGTFNFTIRATDANGCFAELPYALVISTAVPTLPQMFVVLLALGLLAAGYLGLRRRMHDGAIAVAPRSNR